MADNPIKYSDFISPDNSISDLIKQLEKVSAAYTELLNKIKSEAEEARKAFDRLNGATGEGQEATKKAVTDAEKLKKAYDDLQKSQTDTAKTLAALRLEQQQQNAENRNTAKLNASAEGSYNRLAAQYNINKAALNAMGKEMRETTREGQELEAQTKALFDEMKRLQNASGGDSLNVGNYTDSINEALGLNSQFGQSLTGLAQSGEGFRAMFNNIGASVKAFGQTLLTLLTNPVFLVIGGLAAAGAAFKFWYDYNKGLVEATNLTEQFTGKSGNDLKMFRNEAQATADMFGKDFKEVLIATNAVSKQFGITQDEALKLVRDGFIAGGDANGEFLDTLKEYPAYFKEAGISASQFVAITAQQATSGVFSDKGVDTIKEGNLRIREMSKATQDALKGIGIDANQVQKDLQSGNKTTFQVMQEVSKKLNELPANSAKVGTAIADIFGGAGEDAGLEYIKTLKDVNTNLDQMKGKTGELGKLQEEQFKSQLELTNTISALFDSTGGVFESLNTQVSIFVNEALVGMIKGVVSLINYFIELYNNSLLFRANIQYTITAFKLLWEVVSNVFKFIIEQAKVVGEILKSAFTLDFKGVYNAYNKGMQNVITFAKNTALGVSGAVKEGYNNVVKNTKLKPIVIPVKADTKTAKTEAQKTEQTVKKKEPKKVTPAEIENIRKKNLALVREYEDAITNLESNEFDKRQKQAVTNYERKKQDLQYQLKTDKQLNKAGREAINGTIVALEKQKNKELQTIDTERKTQMLNAQKATLDLQLAAVEKGTAKEIEIKKQQIENERKTALLENEKKPAAEQQNTDLINAKFDVQKTALNDEANKIALLNFDHQQTLAASEFDLLKKTEAEKTRFKLEQERDRLKKLLELNETAATKMSAEEIKTTQNTIAKLNNEIANPKREKVDFYSMVGLKLDDEQKGILNDSAQYAIDSVKSFQQAKVDAAEAAVEASNKEVDTAKANLDKEIEAKNNGQASNVARAEKELQEAKKNQDKALKEKEKAQKAQVLLDTAVQTSSLITASANIWASFSPLGPLGPILAIAAMGTMWGSFIASKAKATQATKKTYGKGGLEFLNGGSHASGNDIPLGYTNEGQERRVEGGEALAIISKSKTQKYRTILPKVIDSLNKGVFEQKYGNAYNIDGGSVTTISQNFDTKKLENDVNSIKKQGERKYYTDGKGRTVEIYKNLKRIYNGS